MLSSGALNEIYWEVFWILRQLLSTSFIREVFLMLRQVLSTRFIREVLLMLSSDTLNETY